MSVNYTPAPHRQPSGSALYVRPPRSMRRMHDHPGLARGSTSERPYDRERFAPGTGSRSVAAGFAILSTRRRSTQVVGGRQRYRRDAAIVVFSVSGPATSAVCTCLRQENGVAVLLVPKSVLFKAPAFGEPQLKTHRGMTSWCNRVRLAGAPPCCIVPDRTGPAEPSGDWGRTGVD